MRSLKNLISYGNSQTKVQNSCKEMPFKPGKNNAIAIKFKMKMQNYENTLTVSSKKTNGFPKNVTSLNSRPKRETKSNTNMAFNPWEVPVTLAKTDGNHQTNHLLTYLTCLSMIVFIVKHRTRRTNSLSTIWSKKITNCKDALSNRLLLLDSLWCHHQDRVHWWRLRMKLLLRDLPSHRESFILILLCPPVTQKI